MATAKVLGSFNILQGSNPTLYGDGSLNVYSDINLTKAGNKNIKNTDSTGNLNIQSMGGINTSCENGNASFYNTSSNGTVSILSNGVGSSSTTIGSSGTAGVAIVATNASANIGLTSAKDIVSNSVGKFLVNSTDRTTVTSTAGSVEILSTGTAVTGVVLGTNGQNGISLTSTHVLGDISLTSARNANMISNHVTGIASIQAPTLNLGTTTSTSVNIGNASTTTTIPGNLVVQGTSTKIDTVDLLVKDNIIVANSAPSVAGKDSALFFSRFASDVVSDTTFITTALFSNAAAGATSLIITNIANVYTGATVQISEGANTQNVTVTLGVVAAQQTLTISPALVLAYTTAAVVKVYVRTQAAVCYAEAQDEFQLFHTNTLSTASNIALKEFSTLRVGKLIVGDGVAPSSNADVEVTLVANSATPVNIGQTASKGSYQFIVSCATDDRATATFYCSKGSVASTASIFRMTSAASSFGEEVGISWAANGLPQLYHDSIRVSGTLAESVVYKVKLITNV